MKKNLKVALYDPYLDTLGGGEKHILSILKVLQEEGFEINIFWNKNLQKEIENRFRLQYINRLKFLKNIFQKPSSFIQKLIILKDFDLFFYVTDGSYFFSATKKNFIFSMVPQKSLYQMNALSRLKTLNYHFISNSYFTQSWLKKWGVNSQVIYPYLAKEFIDVNIKDLKKDNIILSVGRFFGHLHSKRQSVLINLFKKIHHKYSLFKDFKLILAGGLKKEDKQFIDELRSLTKNCSNILFETNLPYSRLLELYEKSLFYIHMTGYRVDENRNPELLEHLGIAPLEAMAAGCITFCYNAGGPNELIRNGDNGFLFNSEKELIDKMLMVMNDQKLTEKIRTRAKEYVRNHFSYEVFKKRVKEVIL